MAISVQIPQDQLGDLQSISKAGDEVWQTCLKVLTRSDAKLYTGPAIKAELERCGVYPEVSFSLVRLLLSVRVLSRGAQFDLESAAEAMLDALEEVDEGTYRFFLSRKADLLEMLAAEAITVSSKTHSLSTDHESVFVSSHLVTDFRPVFNGERSEIVAGIVINYLKMDVFDSGARKQVSYVLDETDIDSLISQLQDAKRKAENSAEVFSERLGIKTFLVGDESFGDG